MRKCWLKRRWCSWQKYIECSMSTSPTTSSLTLERFRAKAEENQDIKKHNPRTRPRISGGTSQSFSSFPSLHSSTLLHGVARMVTLSIHLLSPVKVADSGKAFLFLHVSKSSSSSSGQWMTPSQISSSFILGFCPVMESVLLQDIVNPASLVNQ